MAKKKIKNKGKQVNKTVAANNLSNDSATTVQGVVTPPVILPVFLKVCRLCEGKDGPFLNIFDADKVTAKKIDELMPFSVTENDDLPHKICFRCSAKLEELHEFIQKCIKTQENLRDAIGKTGPFITKSKMGKKLWEEKLHKSNMSNDDICDALIKKAMEGIKAISPYTLPIEEEMPTEPKRVTRSKESIMKKETKDDVKSDNADQISLREAKLSFDKNDGKSPSQKVTRTVKAEAAQLLKPEETQTKKPGPQSKKSETQSKKVANQPKKQEAQETSNASQNENKSVEKAKNISLNNFSFDYEGPPIKESNCEKEKEEKKKEEPKKPFNIMDHISMIKVNGVGLLFQCRLCNRNFLKKEVVESHNCAKNGVPKVDVAKTSVIPPEPPKAPSVKYIKIDREMKKTLTEKIKKAESEKNVSENLTTPQDPPPTLKPKPGPASKTKRNVIDLDTSSSQSSSESTTSSVQYVPPVAPSVHFPSLPNLNSRFKLVPGPNNIFTLVEDTNAPPPVVNNQAPTETLKKPIRKRKSDEVLTTHSAPETAYNKSDNPEIINIDDQPKPYPVGLFQAVGHARTLYEPPAPAVVPATFTTPAMKKQSYTIVQTGNPSKLLISTKAKAAELEEAPRKRQRKTKLETKVDDEAKEPYTVTLEDVTPPKDSGFFTFINVDPLLQPSYVLPTDNIIQESQISTSSSVVRAPVETKEIKDNYSCNMCGESFSREKKLLAHIQSHYSKMDEEDQLRDEKNNKKKARK